MGYFDTKKGIEEYIKRSQGWGGPKLINVLKKYLPRKSTLLELGMGPGRDFDILKKTYKATGSDGSKAFLARYKKRDKTANIIRLDAVSIPIDRKFDGIYSNKVLHHLAINDFKKSIRRQRDVLNQDGIAFHSLWKGNKTEYKHGLRFVYYEMDKLEKIIGNTFDILEMKAFTEMEKNDSIYIVLKK